MAWLRPPDLVPAHTGPRLGAQPSSPSASWRCIRPPSVLRWGCSAVSQPPSSSPPAGSSRPPPRFWPSLGSLSRLLSRLLSALPGRSFGRLGGLPPSSKLFCIRGARPFGPTPLRGRRRIARRPPRAASEPLPPAPVFHRHHVGVRLRPPAAALPHPDEPQALGQPQRPLHRAPAHTCQGRDLRHRPVAARNPLAPPRAPPPSGSPS